MGNGKHVYIGLPDIIVRMRLGKKDARRTEQRLAASKKLDRMTAAEIVSLMNREDRRVAAAVGRELPTIARAVDAIVAAMRGGWAIDLCGGGIEREDGRVGCSGMSTDVWDFAEADDRVDCGREARGNRGR